MLGGRYFAVVPPVWCWGKNMGSKESMDKVRKIVPEDPVKAIAFAGIAKTKDLPVENAPARQGNFLPVHQIRLLPGTIFYDREQDMLGFLRTVSNDSMLYNFRRASGLDTRGAAPMTGWDAEDCRLKGHTTGHYLSALALAYAATGEEVFRENAGKVITGLRECQLAFERDGRCHKGFLSAYSEEQFDLLEKYTKYPEIWAPYYTLDKIMAGLIDCYQLAGCGEALEILRPLGEWVWNRLSRLPENQRQKMWSMYIAGEFGGMIGTMARLGEITGDVRNLEAARFFDNEKLFRPMELGIDTLEGMHANQHIPQAIGQLELYRLEGKIRDYLIGRNFWKMVTGAHAYCIGGVGEAELFHRAKMMTSYLTDKTAESCASYNMCRLTGQLFAYTEDARMMDYYEWTLCNHLMASASHTADGGTTYFMPLGPGMRKAWSTSENSCCHGTGMESRFRYLGNIFFQDRDSLRICLFADCVLSGENALEMRTSEDYLTITAKADMALPLRIRIPGWAKAWKAELNGENLAAEAEAGWFFLPRCLQKEETVRIHFPHRVQVSADRFDPAYATITDGPWILAALSEKPDFLDAPAASSIVKIGPETFGAGKVRMIPLARVDQEAYHVYFKKK